MDRLFQDDHGDADELVGASISSATAVVDTADQNVVVLWLEDGTRSCWYRVFIDGIYCGIDRYRRCEIEEDLIQKQKYGIRRFPRRFPRHFFALCLKSYHQPRK